MTIRRGEDWGRPGPLPGDLEWFDDDAGAAIAYRDGRRDIGVRHGDLARTLGVREGAVSGESGVACPIDVMQVSSSDGRRIVAVAHVVVRDRRWGWWRGRFVALMNAQYIGKWDVAPRGHPNDGRLELLEVDASMSIRQRVLARRRLPTGGHVPHPLITTRSTARVSITVSSSSRVEVDGRPWRSNSSERELTIDVEVVPDALVVWVPGVR